MFHSAARSHLHTGARGAIHDVMASAVATLRVLNVRDFAQARAVEVRVPRLPKDGWQPAAEAADVLVVGRDAQLRALLRMLRGDVGESAAAAAAATRSMRRRARSHRPFKFRMRPNLKLRGAPPSKRARLHAEGSTQGAQQVGLQSSSPSGRASEQRAAGCGCGSIWYRCTVC